MARHHSPHRKESPQPSPKPPSAALQTRPFAPTPDSQDLASPHLNPASSAPTFVIADPSGTSRHPIQPKLTIGAPGDKYEQEADRVASQVVQHIHSPSPNADHAVQREAMPEEEELQMKPMLQREAIPEEEEELQMKPMLQREAMPEEEELQMKPTGGMVTGDASPHLETEIQRAKGSGQILAPELQAKMGQAMGADFSGVRVHTNPQADHLNRSIQAKAFTTGQDIFFRQGAYQPGSRGGQELIAHELTHVVQQNGALASTTNSTLQGKWSLGKRHATAAKKAKALGPGNPEHDSQVLDALDTAVSTSGVSTLVSDEYGVAKTMGNAALDSSQDRNLGVAGGATDFLSMFTGLASAVKDFRKNEASGGDKAGAVLSGIHAGLTGAKGAAAIVDKSAQIAKDSDEGIGESVKAAGSLAGIANSFGVIKETFFAIKEIVDLAKDAQSLSSEEKFRASMSIIKRLLEAAKSGVSAAKSFWDTWGGGAAGPLVQSVPGLGIALSCVDLIVRGVDLVTAEVRKADMRSKKRELKAKFGGKKGASSKAEAERILKDPQSTPEAKADAEEYLLAKGLQYINQKRSNRAILKIAVTMGKIAGDAATLGGASAPVGVGLKVGAMGVDLGATVFRNVKQMGRDKAEKSASGSLWRTIFNSDKSTQKKLAEYNKTIDQVFDMIIKADATTGPTREGAMERCGDYISAMGFSIAEMHRYRTTPDKLREKMIEALKKRE